MGGGFTVFGSGFGIYGYLPALILSQIATRVYLPQTYKEKVYQREELIPYFDHIEWFSDINTILPIVEGIVVASKPSEQIKIVNMCLKFENIKYVFVEKPLAQNSREANSLLQLLISSKLQFRIGYTFFYTKWYQSLKNTIKSLGSAESVLISWKFHSHHFVNNISTWKRYDLEGGGAFKFYAIHIIALLADLGYSTCISSHLNYSDPGETESWSAVFIDNDLPICKINLNSRSKINEFSITNSLDTKENVLIQLSDPFELINDSPVNSRDDRRVVVLRELCNSIKFNSPSMYLVYSLINKLWEHTESTSQFKIINRTNHEKKNFYSEPLL